VVRVKCAVMAVGVVGITKMRARGTCRQPAVIYLAPPPRQASLRASKGAIVRQSTVRGCKLYGGGLSYIRLELKRCVLLRVLPLPGAHAESTLVTDGGSELASVDHVNTR
jgi:hypothetical protein